MFATPFHKGLDLVEKRVMDILVRNNPEGNLVIHPDGLTMESLVLVLEHNTESFTSEDLQELATLSRGPQALYLRTLTEIKGLSGNRLWELQKRTKFHDKILAKAMVKVIHSHGALSLARPVPIRWEDVSLKVSRKVSSTIKKKIV